ncbi:MAG TPA: glycosyltransferase [Chloroflexota bacterium]|jgi:glycosyltransferase involved in cell wall biosynthesis|nr:glycosyltransferase [Chloroflexota bacterium]
MTLRILHVTPYFRDAWGYGGIPRIASTLVRELAHRGHAVTVCTTDAADAGTRSAAPATGSTETGAVDVRIFPNLSNTLAYHQQLFLPRGLSAFLSAHAARFDVAHLHACRNLPVSIASRYLRRAGIPYVLAPNGTALRIERRRAAKWVYDRVIGRQDLDAAACVIAVSEAERRQLEEMGVRQDKIRLLPNPVDLDEHRQLPRAGAFRAAYGLGSSRVVLYLGKLTPRKGVDVLLRAFGSGLASDVRLVIAGNDMGTRQSLERLAGQSGLQDRVLFTGLLQGVARLEALADADVLVYPSSDEVFGLVPLEALLTGTPVIVSDDSGCGELIAQMGGGLLTPLGDPGALAAAIRRVLAAPDEWRARALTAAGLVRQRYGGSTVAAKLDGLYHDVLAAR